MNIIRIIYELINALSSIEVEQSRPSILGPPKWRILIAQPCQLRLNVAFFYEPITTSQFPLSF